MAIVVDLQAPAQQTDQLSLLVGFHACQHASATHHHLHCVRVHLLHSNNNDDGTVSTMVSGSE